MKPILPILISIAFFSCTPMHYYFVSGNNISKNPEDELVFENDTLRIAYNFNGLGGPVKISIFNKTGEPMEINWRKSALIFNDRAYSYYNSDAYINGSMVTDTSRDYVSRRTVYFSDLSARIQISEPIQYLPPRSSVSRHSLNLLESRMEDLSFERASLEKIKGESGMNVKVKKMRYLPGLSPVVFRSYLVFSIGLAPGREFASEHSFYISEIWETLSAPAYLSPYMQKRGDCFYR